MIPVEPVTDGIKKKAENGNAIDLIKSSVFDNGVSLENRRTILEYAITAMAMKFTAQKIRREIGCFCD